MHGHHRRARAHFVRETENGERSTTRVQLEMPPQAMERLQRLKERTEAAVQLHAWPTQPTPGQNSHPELDMALSHRAEGQDIIRPEVQEPFLETRT